jgi:hypothetical protein
MGNLLRCGFALVVVLSAVPLADAHGIAGNRYFDGTMTIDDPAVADEAILSDYAHLAQPSEGSSAINDRINWSTPASDSPTACSPALSGFIIKTMLVTPSQH